MSWYDTNYYGSLKDFKSGTRNVRHCVFYNNNTKEAYRCQFNPSDLPRTRSVNYSSITSPGMAYPLVQFVSGEIEDMDINLFFYDRKDTSKIKAFDTFINGLLPPEHNANDFTKPPTFKFYYGTLKVNNYVLVKKSINSELRDETGNVYCLDITLSVRRV